MLCEYNIDDGSESRELLACLNAIETNLNVTIHSRARMRMKWRHWATDRLNIIISKLPILILPPSMSIFTFRFRYVINISAGLLVRPLAATLNSIECEFREKQSAMWRGEAYLLKRNRNCIHSSRIWFVCLRTGFSLFSRNLSILSHNLRPVLMLIGARVCCKRLTCRTSGYTHRWTVRSMESKRSRNAKKNKQPSKSSHIFISILIWTNNLFRCWFVRHRCRRCFDFIIIIIIGTHTHARSLRSQRGERRAERYGPLANNSSNCAPVAYSCIPSPKQREIYRVDCVVYVEIWFLSIIRFSWGLFSLIFIIIFLCVYLCAIFVCAAASIHWYANKEVLPVFGFPPCCPITSLFAFDILFTSLLIGCSASMGSGANIKQSRAYTEFCSLLAFIELRSVDLWNAMREVKNWISVLFPCFCLGWPRRSLLSWMGRNAKCKNENLSFVKGAILLIRFFVITIDLN